MFFNRAAGGVMQVAVVQVIDVITVLNRRVAATGAVLVRVVAVRLAHGLSPGKKRKRSLDGHGMAETRQEFGANFVPFGTAGWNEPAKTAGRESRSGRGKNSG
jgi:hypothetical protein